VTGTSGVPPLASALLLRLAGRRWPAELRTEMLQEWQAEVAAIGADPTRTPVVRTVRQLRFAISLAGSPPVEDEYGVPRGWREYLPGVGRTLRPPLMLLGAVLLAIPLAVVLATRVVPTSPSRVSPTFVPNPRGHDERISIPGSLGRADG